MTTCGVTGATGRHGRFLLRGMRVPAAAREALA